MNLIKKNNTNRKLFAVVLLLTLMILPMFALIPNSLMSNVGTEKLIEDDVESEKLLDQDDELVSIIESNPKSSASEGWWNENWYYRLPIQIVSTSEDLVDFQVKISINMTDLYDLGYIEDDGRDLRFVNATNDKLPYWIEFWDLADEKNCTIWVKVPQLDQSVQKTIYMYFGNPSATSESRGEATFELFDDFKGSSLNATKWYSSGASYSVSNSILTITRGATGLRNALDFKIQDNFMVETLIKFVSDVGGYSGTIPEVSSSRYTQGSNAGGDANILYMRQNGGTLVYYWAGDGSTTGYNLGSGSTGWNSGTSPTDWFLTGISIIGGDTSSTAKLWRNGTDIFQITGIGWAKDIRYTSLGYFNGGTGDGQDVSYDWIRIRKNATVDPTVTIGEWEAQFAEVEVICKDVDGNIIPNANVTLLNQTLKNQGVPKAQWQYHNNLTGDDGAINYILDHGRYNFTVTYKIETSGIDKLMLNTSASTSGYYFTGTTYQVVLVLNMTTINFQFKDWGENNPIDQGHVKVWDSNEKNTLLDTIQLDSYGVATFRYRNESDFYYEAYYANTDYRGGEVLLNASTIQRQDYVDNSKLTVFPTVNVNETNAPLNTPDSHVVQFFYSSQQKSIYSWVVNLTIGLEKMKSSINYLKVYYVDIDGNAPESHLIFKKDDYAAQTSDRIQIDIRNTTETCQELINDNYQAYGIKLDLLVTNSSAPCNGTIKVNMTEKWHVYNRTALSRISINVTENSLDKLPVEGVLIQVNGTATTEGDLPTTSLANLTTKDTGFAYGSKNDAYEFWYLRGHDYNFTCFFYGRLKPVELTYSDPSQPKSGDKTHVNYTLLQDSDLRFKIVISLDDYSSNFTDVYADTSITHGSIMRFEVNYTIESPEFTGGLTNPDEIKAEVRTLIGFRLLLTNDSMIHLGGGEWQAKFDTSLLSAGNSSKSYWVVITGSKLGYQDPPSKNYVVTVNAKGTSITIHNQSQLAETFDSTNVLTVDYNVRVNVSVRYFESLTSTSISNAKLFYDWQPTLNPVEFYQDPINPNYYVFELNTSDVANVGKYRIEITAYKENYTKQTAFGFDIQIQARRTILKRLNVTGETGKTELYHIASSLYIGRKMNYTFEYNDTRLDKRLNGVTATYTWFKVNPSGQRIAGFEGEGTLTESEDKEYILDFISDLNVKSSGVKNGSYAIFITFMRANYELRNAFIDLSILIRPTTLNDTNYKANPQTDPLLEEIYVGDSINFTFEYRSIDPADGNQLLTSYIQERYFTWTKIGANQNGTLQLNVTNGIYKLDFNTPNKTAGNYLFVVYIKTVNYSRQVFTISLEIKTRQINYTLSGFTGGQISIKQGINKEITLTLTDNSRNGAALLGATVTLTIGGQSITLTDEDGDGIYTGIFDSGKINTFLQQEALTGTIKIEKSGYETKEITVTVVVRMVDTPFLEGVPLFWMVMGIVLVGGIVGSLGTYRYIQVAKIPEFVKRANRVKNAIKSGKEVSEADTYPSKSHVAVKMHGKDWELLGLSLADILGIEITKAKKLPDASEETSAIKKEKVKVKKEKAPKEKKEKKPKKEKAAKERKEEPELPSGGADE